MAALEDYILNDENGLTYDDSDIRLFDVFTGRNDFKVAFNFNIEYLTLMCKLAVTCNNRHVNRIALQNLKNLIDMTDITQYISDDEFNARFEFINLAIECRIDSDIEKKKIILAHVEKYTKYPEVIKKFIEDELDDTDNMSNKMVKYVNKYIYDNLTCGYSYRYTEKLVNIHERRESGSIKDIQTYSTEFDNIIKTMNDDMRSIRSFGKAGKKFDLSESNFKSGLMEAYKDLTAPTNKWVTGIRYLNKMLNGGLEAGRSYLFLAITGGGKSIILLLIALWVKKYNKNKTKDPTKKATVLYITMENSFSETIERIWNMCISNDDIRDYTYEEVELRLREYMNIDLTDEINLVIREYREKEIGVSDIYDIVNELEEEGNEVILISHDYIQRLKPPRTGQELRLELADIANEIAVLAKELGIPFVTAAQLNRTASQTVENAIVTNRKDCIRLLGKSNTGESWGMMQNVDVSIIVGTEVVGDVEKEPELVKRYMAFHKVKFRGNPGKSDIKYFAHPYKDGSTISLIDDFYLEKPLSKLSIADFGTNSFNKSDGQSMSGVTSTSIQQDFETSFYPSFNVDTFERSGNALTSAVDKLSRIYSNNDSTMEYFKDQMFINKDLYKRDYFTDNIIIEPAYSERIGDSDLYRNTLTNNVIMVKSGIVLG